MDADAGQKTGGDKGDTKLPVKRTGVMEFVSQVRQETARVTWPSRRETTTTAIAVFIMVLLAMIFFFAVDWAIGHLVSFVLGLV